MRKRNRKDGGGTRSSEPASNDGDSRVPGLSRRAVLTSVSAVAFQIAMDAEEASHLRRAVAGHRGDGSQRCLRWLAINAELGRLQALWGTAESRLATDHSWFELSVDERMVSPHGEHLRSLDRQLDILYGQRDELLKTIASYCSGSLPSIIARLAVAERLLSPVENPDLHALIAGARRDLILVSEETGTV